MSKEIVTLIRRELKDQADEKTRASAHSFFKEAALFHGVKTQLVDQIAQKYYPQVKLFPKEEIFALCEDLLTSDYGEEAFIAFDWAYRLREKYVPADFAIFEHWLVKYVNNWAKCDTLCNHTIGAFIEKYPRFISNLKGWAMSENRWVRRASSVTLIIPARKGQFLTDIFEIAGILLSDQDDLVQKGYGWMLKAASQSHQKEVFDYVMKNKTNMPRTALRYAIEKMPPEMKRLAMAKN
jgi:3-methyladenine DNA glycosylase AlkD